MEKGYGAMSRSWNGIKTARDWKGYGEGVWKMSRSWNGIKIGTGRVEQIMNGMGLKLGLEG